MSIYMTHRCFSDQYSADEACEGRRATLFNEFVDLRSDDSTVHSTTSTEALVSRRVLPSLDVANAELANGATDQQEQLPDNVFDRLDWILSKLPPMAMQSDGTAARLMVSDLGNAIAAKVDLTKEQLQLLNDLSGLSVTGDKLSLRWQSSADVKAIMPNAEEIPDGSLLRITDPTFRVSANIGKKEITFSDINGIVAQVPALPFPVPAIKSIVARHTTDKGKSLCEIEIWTIASKQPIVKKLNLSDEQASSFDALVQNISAGKGCSKLVELLPSLLLGESAGIILPLLADLKQGTAVNGTVHLQFANVQRLRDLPLEIGPNVSFKSIANNGAYVFSDIKGIKLQLPIPSEILEKLGGDKEGKVAELVVKAAEDGTRYIKAELTSGALKSIIFAVDKSGSPILRNNCLAVKVTLSADNEKSFDCTLNLPTRGTIKDGVAISIGGDPQTRELLLRQLALPAELCRLGKEVCGIAYRNESAYIRLEKPVTMAVRGMNLQFSQDIVVSESKKPVWARLLLDMPDQRSYDVSGIELTGFNFAGDKWKQIGSAILNEALNLQNDLPITLDSISFMSRADGKLGMSFTSRGAIKWGSFLLENEKNPVFVSGLVSVKNPLRNLDPVNWLCQRDRDIIIELDGDGVTNPADTLMSLLEPLSDNLLVDVLSPIKKARYAWRFVRDPEEGWNHLKRDASDARQAAEDAIKFVGRNVGDAGTYVGKKAGSGARFVGRNLESAWDALTDW
jgi:hypothetical protein